MYGFGSGLLYGVRNDIASQTPQRFGAMQDIQLDIAGDIKELYGQNQYPLAVARGKIKLTAKAKMAVISPILYNNLFFGGTLTSASNLLAAYQEADTVPAVSTYTITVTHAGTFDMDLGVRYAATGIPLKLVASVTAVGSVVRRGAVDVGAPLFALLDLPIESFEPAACPQCGAGELLDEPGSRFLQR